MRTAKLALDEIQTRLKLIAELDAKLHDETMDEVADLQPLFERSLWVFGPEFESLEFTSNRGMTTVINKIFGNGKDRCSARTSSCCLIIGKLQQLCRVATRYERLQQTPSPTEPQILLVCEAICCAALRPEKTPSDSDIPLIYRFAQMPIAARPIA